ncbi:hypothetical protein BGLA2_2200005 [Burkholderia gladioli]|nr:hypothetical protein BGLA2_2200005 [Burkholderia gladioli]
MHILTTITDNWLTAATVPPCGRAYNGKRFAILSRPSVMRLPPARPHALRRRQIGVGARLAGSRGAHVTVPQAAARRPR